MVSPAVQKVQSRRVKPIARFPASQERLPPLVRSVKEGETVKMFPPGSKFPVFIMRRKGKLFSLLAKD